MKFLPSSLRNLSTVSLIALVVIVVLAVVVVAGPKYSRLTQSSVLLAQDDERDDEDQDEEDDDGAVTAKLLKYLNDAEKELGVFEKQVEGYAKSMKACDKKKAGKTRTKCVDPLVKKMKASQKGLCEYADVLPAECGLLDPKYRGNYPKDFFKHFTNKLADDTRKSLAQKRDALTRDDEEGNEDEASEDLGEEEIDESDYVPVQAASPLRGR
mgnify:CR=1 FL=1